MGRTPRHNLIKRLHAELPRGEPVGISDLKALGVSATLAAQHAGEGWLVRVGHGVYALPGDPLTVHGMVRFLQARVEGLHVGGRSALALHGVRHTLGVRETLVLWGDVRFRLPDWFLERTAARYVGTALFDWPDAKFAKSTLGTPPGVTEGLRVSVPERAVLEMLHEVGRNEHIEEARGIFEGLRNPRLEVMGRLLNCCTSVKAVRLFLTWCRETQLLDVDRLIERFEPRVGSNSRWIAKMKDGTTLSLRPHG